MSAPRPDTQGLPDPPVPADTDIKGLDKMMLDCDRLLASELWALSTGEEFKAAVTLWCRAWRQSPPGSLPNDDRVLAAFSGAGPRWPKVRAMALRGFVECSDGRLYHRVLCADVLRAAEKKRERAERTKAATAARLRKAQDNAQRDERHSDDRNEQRNDPRDVDVTSAVTTPHRRDETRRDDSKKEESPPSEGSGPPRPSDAHAAIAAWNHAAPELGLACVQIATPTRCRHVAARLRECGGLPGWAEALAKIRASPFLRGDNDRGWRCDFDWICKPANFAKLMEGNYDGRKPNGTHDPAERDRERRAVIADVLGLDREAGGPDPAPSGHD